MPGTELWKLHNIRIGAGSTDHYSSPLAAIVGWACVVLCPLSEFTPTP